MVAIAFTAASFLLPLLAVFCRLRTVIGFYLIVLTGAQPHVAALNLLLALAISAGLIRDRWSGRLDSGQYMMLIIAATNLLLAVFSLLRSDNIARGFSETMQYVLVFSAVIALTLSIRERRDIQIVLSFACLGSTLLAAFNIGNQLEIWAVKTTAFILIDQSNYGAAFGLLWGILGPLLLLRTSISPLSRIALIATICVNLVGIFIVDSRASMLMGGVIVLVALFDYRSRNKRAVILWRITFISLCIFVLEQDFAFVTQSSLWNVFNFETQDSNLARLGLLLTSWELFASHPLGLGIGSADRIFIELHGVPHPHNTLALYAVEMGIAGIFAYFLFVMALLRLMVHALAIKCRQFRTIILLAVPCMVGLSVSDPVQYNGPYMMMFFMFLSLETRFVNVYCQTE